MKKTFYFSVPNKSPERQVDSIKHQIKKYIARERRKPLPEKVNYWDFDCSMGEDDQSAAPIHISEINQIITRLAAEKNESFYIEILAKPGHRTKK